MSLSDRFEVSLPDGWQSQLPENDLQDDRSKMSFVIGLAKWNVDNQTGGPFAAAVFDQVTNELVAIGVNRVVPEACSLAHAEAVAIALAQNKLGSHNLAANNRKLELFASGQPCVQCFGMTWWSGVVRLAIGATAQDIEELTSFSEGPLPENWKSRLANRTPLPAIQVDTNICRTEARHVLEAYALSGGNNYSPGA